MSKIYQEEQNIVAESFFHNLFFKHYTPDANRYTNLELYLDTDCNMKCPYCYLYRFGDKLYPKELRDLDQIKTNLGIVMDWMIEKNYFIKSLDVFSGELFKDQFGIDAMNIILEKCQQKRICDTIVIPSNFSFLHDDKMELQVRQIIKDFKKLDINVFISCSVDGAPIDKISRAIKADSAEEFRTDAYYDKLVKFVKEYDYGFHPMVGRIFVENYEEVYTWWVNTIVNNDIRLNDKYATPMFLEIRNDDWPDDLLEKYSDMLKFMVKTDLEKYHNGDVVELTHRLFLTPSNPFRQVNEICRFPLDIARCSCAVQASPYIRLGDLSLVPCHRTSYPQFTYGKFIVENGRISGIKAQNISLAMKIYSMNPAVSHPKCSDCLIGSFCIKGCLGAQYEVNKELFHPISSVCNLMYTKFKTLVSIYKEYDMFNIIYGDKSIPNYFKDRIKKGERILCQLNQPELR